MTIPEDIYELRFGLRNAGHFLAVGKYLERPHNIVRVFCSLRNGYSRIHYLLGFINLKFGPFYVVGKVASNTGILVGSNGSPTTLARPSAVDNTDDE